jgi:hypothetical protein
MARKIINKINEKLTKVDDGFHVYMYDNGFMFELTGRNSKDDYTTVKIMVSTVEELYELFKEAASMDRV